MKEEKRKVGRPRLSKGAGDRARHNRFKQIQTEASMTALRILGKLVA
jgi:hypothetical protein